jgi:hypothetical protein
MKTRLGILILGVLLLTSCGKTEVTGMNDVPPIDFPLDVPEFFHCEMTQSFEFDKVLTYLYTKCTEDALVAYRDELEQRGWIIDHIGPVKKNTLNDFEPPSNATGDGFELVIGNGKYILTLSRYTTRNSKNARITVVDTARMLEE